MQAGLAGPGSKSHRRPQISELPEIKPVVIETRQHELLCPACGHVERGILPTGLEAERHFGPWLGAAVTHLQHQQHLSNEHTQAALADLFGVALSEGGQACIFERAGQAAKRRSLGCRLRFARMQRCIVTKLGPGWIGEPGGSGCSSAERQCCISSVPAGLWMSLKK